MISGSIVYKYRGKSFRYTVDAFDTSECFSFYITSGSYNAIAMMVSPNEEESEKYDALWERSVEVKLSKLTVKTGVTLNEAGKKVKDPVNSDMFCRLAALIRYVKTNCTVRNERGYTGLELASSDFEAIKRKVYDIPYPMDLSKLLATVTLEYGNIVALKLWHQDFDMDLEVTGDAERVFYRPKDGWASGFRLTSEYLGFPLPEQKVIKVSDDNLYHSLEEVMQAHPEKELAWLRDKNYIIVTDDTLEEICSYIMNWDGYVEYDTETSGLNINFMSRVGQADQCVGIILSVKYGESFFFPMQMKAIRNLCGGDHYYFMEHYAKPILEKKELVVHNLSFDWKVAYIYGINCNIVHDTMIMLQLTFGAEIKDYKVGLKENSKLLLGRDSLELSDLVVDNSWGESDIRFWDLPEELVKLYACADTDNTLGLLEYMTQNDILSKYNATKVYEIEVAFAYAVGYQEFFGHRIDVDDVDMLSKEVHEEIDVAKRKMVEICGHDFNPNSPIQLRTIMYDELKIPEQISRKTGKVTTDKETLKRLAEITDIEDNLKYPFCGYMLDLRKSEGVRKIVDKFPEYMTPDGYIFAHVMQLGTTTGRVSINTPNYQSYSDPIKKRVVPRPGFYMTDTDYSSIEYRVLANMVGNKNIMHSFEDPDFDYHTYQAAHMYGVPYAAVTKAMRKAAKGINFGIPYGMGDESLGVRVYGEESPENTRKAAGLRNAYFKGQEDIRDWFEFHRNKGVNNGYTETYFNRRRYYRRSDFTESAIRRQAGNQVVQGSAADLYKLAVGNIFKRICKEGWLGKVLFPGFIHDELLAEVSNEINPGVWLRVLREEFEVKVFNDDGSPWCPLYMGFGYGMSWYEAKSVELPIKLQWELETKYGVDGFPDWDGDGRAFCDKLPDILRDFEVRDIRNQILDPENQGKEIKPALNTQIIDCLKEDAKEYEKYIARYIQETGGYKSDVMSLSERLKASEEDICKYLDQHCHIQCLYHDADGNFIDKFSPSKSTQEMLDQYCILHGVDRSKVDLLDIPEFDASTSNSFDTDAFDETDADDDSLQRIRDTRIDTLGMYLDVDERIVTLLIVPPQYMSFIQQRVNREGKGYRVFFKDTFGLQNPNMLGGLYSTECYLTSDMVQTIQQMYLQYFKTR